MLPSRVGCASGVPVAQGLCVYPLLALHTVMSDPSNSGVYPCDWTLDQTPYPRKISIFTFVPSENTLVAPENLGLEGHAHHCLHIALGKKWKA